MYHLQLKELVLVLLDVTLIIMYIMEKGLQHS